MTDMCRSALTKILLTCAILTGIIYQKLWKILFGLMTNWKLWLKTGWPLREKVKPQSKCINEF